jgi:hypothetical protein
MVILEIDYMKGTKLPPGVKMAFGLRSPVSTPPVSFEGKTHTLEDIFMKAGLRLDIQVSDEIATLGDTYSLRDLIGIMRNKSTRNTLFGSYAYLLIVNGIYLRQDDDGVMRPDPDTLGVMFDMGKREGTAVFYQNDWIKTQPVAYLRTTAHELGHQFNLHHRDGDMYKIPGSQQRKYTIMNQTGIIVEFGKWPAGILLEFGQLEIDHLSKHPKNYVDPGKSRFDGTCGTSDHEQWHDEAPNRLDVTSGLTGFDTINSEILDFEIQMGKNEYLPGQPSIAYLKLSNNGSEPISLIDSLDPQYSTVKFYVNGVRFLPYAYIDFVPKMRVLNPGESIVGRAKIFYGSEGYTFPEPGTYKVRATYQGLTYGLGKVIDSNIIDVIIRPPKDKEEEDQMNLIKGDQQALFFLFEGGDDLTEGISQLTKLAQKYPHSTLGSYANAALGLHWSREFKDFKNSRVRKPDEEKARPFLEAATDSTKGYWADAAFLNLADIEKKKGDKESMKNILDRYIQKFENDSKNTNGLATARRILNEG